MAGGLVRDAFHSKIVLEKVEPGVELFYGDIFHVDEDYAGDDAGGRIIVNNGRIFVFFAVRCYEHMCKLRAELSLNEEDCEDGAYDEEDYRLRFPLPRMPYTFYVGEVKVKPGSTDLKEGVVIEGIWWETQLEKYAHEDIFNEGNFSAKGNWKVVEPFTDADKAAMMNNNNNNDNNNNNNLYGENQIGGENNDDEVEVWD